MKTIFTIALILAVSALAGCASSPAGGVFKSSAETVTTNPLAWELPPSQQENPGVMGSQAKADYYFTLAESYSLQGDGAHAVENYKAAIAHDPQSAHMRYRLALEYIKLGLVSEALASATKGQELSPDHRDLTLLLGGLYSALSLFDQAMEQYKSQLLKDPNDLEANLFVGALLAEEGHFDEAIQHFLELSRNRQIPEKSQVWFYLGRIYSSMDPPQIKNAEAAFVTAIKLKGEDVDAVTALGTLYEVQGLTQKAKLLYHDYQQAQGHHPGVAERLGALHLADSELEQAYQQFSVVEKHNPQDFNIKLKVALLLVEKKQYSLAIEKLQALASQQPRAEKVRFYLGALYEEIEDYPAAIQEFKTISFGSEFFEDSVMHGAYLYKLLGQNAKAISEIRRGLKHEPNNPRYWILHGTLLDEEGRLDQAAQVLAKAYEKFPENTQVNFQLGSVYDRLGRKDQTVLHLEKVLELDENHVQALNYLAYVYAENTNNLEAAEKLAKKALSLQPGDGFILDTLGWVYYKKGQTNQAVSTLEQAFGKEPGEAIIAEHLADAYERHQLHNKAVTFYQKAYQLEQDSQQKGKIRRKLATIQEKIASDQKQRSHRVPSSR